MKCGSYDITYYATDKLIRNVNKGAQEELELWSYVVKKGLHVCKVSSNRVHKVLTLLQGEPVIDGCLSQGDQPYVPVVNIRTDSVYSESIGFSTHTFFRPLNVGTNDDRAATLETIEGATGRF